LEENIIMRKATDANHHEPAPGEEKTQERLNVKAAARAPGPDAKDRPGFDLGGAVTDAKAGSGLGPGEDASESGDRRLPGRRPKNKLGLPRFGGSVVSNK
jgi:hypothetical protein